MARVFNELRTMDKSWHTHVILPKRNQMKSSQNVTDKNDEVNVGAVLNELKSKQDHDGADKTESMQESREALSTTLAKMEGLQIQF